MKAIYDQSQLPNFTYIDFVKNLYKKPINYSKTVGVLMNEFYLNIHHNLMISAKDSYFETENHRLNQKKIQDLIFGNLIINTNNESAINENYLFLDMAINLDSKKDEEPTSDSKSLITIDELIEESVVLEKILLPGLNEIENRDNELSFNEIIYLGPKNEESATDSNSLITIDELIEESVVVEKIIPLGLNEIENTDIKLSFNEIIYLGPKNEESASYSISLITIDELIEESVVVEKIIPLGLNEIENQDNEISKEDRNIIFYRWYFDNELYKKDIFDTDISDYYDSFIASTKLNKKKADKVWFTGRIKRPFMPQNFKNDKNKRAYVPIIKNIDFLLNNIYVDNSEINVFIKNKQKKIKEIYNGIKTY